MVFRPAASRNKWEKWRRKSPKSFGGLWNSRRCECRWRCERAVNRQIRGVKFARCRKMIEGFERRLLGRRNGRLRRLRHAVAAARARFVRAVADQRLAFVQLDLAIRPINVVAHSIRNVHCLVVVERDHSRRVDVEVRVVFRHYRVVMSSRQQFPRALHAARNHGIWVEVPSRRQTIRHPFSYVVRIRGEADRTFLRLRCADRSVLVSQRRVARENQNHQDV